MQTYVSLRSVAKEFSETPWCENAVAEQRSEKTEENKHSAVIVGINAASEALLGLKIEV